MTTIPAQITFRGLAHDDTLEADVRERIAWLEQFYTGIVRCRVVVERPYRHRHDGRLFHVGVELTVPDGPPIVVSHEPSRHGGLKDVEADAHRKEDDIAAVHRHASVAIREAFDAARRRLEDFAREQRGAVKTHDAPIHGDVVELQTADGRGVIQAGEGRFPFDRASVLDDAFDRLTIGTRVAFVEEPGEEGPHATTVRVLGRHRSAAP
jgi:hypothetical protein